MDNAKVSESLKTLVNNNRKDPVEPFGIDITVQIHTGTLKLLSDFITK